MTLHGKAETQDSLDHWIARDQAERRGEAKPDPTGIETPLSRIRRLEAELAKVPDRLFAQGAVFGLSLIFLALGWRWWKKNARG